MMQFPNLGLHFSDGMIMLDPYDLLDNIDALSIRSEADHGRFDTLLFDLVRLNEGWRPGPVELANVPKLSGWRIVEVGPWQNCLMGHVTGHPGFPAGHWVMTSMLVALDTGTMEWARTFSRFYRLSNPLQAGS